MRKLKSDLRFLNIRFVVRLLEPALEGDASGRRYEVKRFLVHRPTAETERLAALRPGVRAGSVPALLTALRGR